MCLEAQARSLADLVSYCEQSDVVAVAIDAQLTIALSEDNGFRTCDRELQSLLPQDCQNWVASINSLMAVPIRGRLLAEALSPVVGTILETHPRACALFALGENLAPAVRRYKKGEGSAQYVLDLWHAWCSQFGIHTAYAPRADGAFDALVCATVAYLFHHAPHRLRRLRHTVPERQGRGPFYVVEAPEVEG